VRSINPLVGETNDGGLNDIRAKGITAAHVRQALDGAAGGPVVEGSVGAGHGTVAFGWKGGIGTSSRVLPKSLGAYTVGVLVQSNFGGVLQVMGAPVGKELALFRAGDVDAERGDGSIMMVVATDALLGPQPRTLAARAIMDCHAPGRRRRTGAGTTSWRSRRRPACAPARPSGGMGSNVRKLDDLANDAMSRSFRAWWKRRRSRSTTRSLRRRQ
jgi:D-aminopeptidase